MVEILSLVEIGKNDEINKTRSPIFSYVDRAKESRPVLVSVYGLNR